MENLDYNIEGGLLILLQKLFSTLKLKTHWDEHSQ